jgi:hypothetical protein
LKKSHNEQLIKSQEARLKSEKQSQELNEKAKEISVAKQMCKELKCSLNKIESIIKQVSVANDKLIVFFFFFFFFFFLRNISLELIVMRSPLNGKKKTKIWCWL